MNSCIPDAGRQATTLHSFISFTHSFHSDFVTATTITACALVVVVNNTLIHSLLKWFVNECVLFPVPFPILQYLESVGHPSCVHACTRHTRPVVSYQLDWTGLDWTRLDSTRLVVTNHPTNRLQPTNDDGRMRSIHHLDRLTD